MTSRGPKQSSRRAQWLPRAVGVAGGVFFAAFGLWAMLGPESFFEAAAPFDPYNQHFIQDIGAFQIGLGAVLLFAAIPARGDALAVALLGVGVGQVAHTISHVVGQDLGGTPAIDIPVFGLLAVLLLSAGALRWREQAAASD